MPENTSPDGRHPTGVTAGDVPAARPDEWVAPGGIPSGGVADAPAPLVLTYTVTVADTVASVLDHAPTRTQYEAAVRKAGWRRTLQTMPLPLVLVLLANLFMFDLGLVWSVASTAAMAGLLAVVRWSQIDHAITRSLPAVVEKQALRDLARRGDQRWLSADAAGLTLGDAAGSARFGWAEVGISATDRHVLLTIGPATWAIPKRLGEPLADVVRFAETMVASRSSSGAPYASPTGPAVP